MWMGRAIVILLVAAILLGILIVSCIRLESINKISEEKLRGDEEQDKWYKEHINSKKRGKDG